MTATRRFPAAPVRIAAFAPVVAILVVQLVLFPLPAGEWVRGAMVGGLTALVALGMALVYQANRVISFAQADLGMAPVVLTTLLITAWGWPWAVAVPAGLIAAAVLGVVVEVGIIRRFRHAPRLLLMVATIGLAQVLAGLALVLPRLFDTHLPAPRLAPPFDARIEVAGRIFGPNDVLAVIAVPAAVALLALLLRRTDVGLAARAVADRADRAGLLGIPVGRIQTAVWAVAAVLAFVAVLLRAGVLGLPVGMALSLGILLRALAALLIGRFTNLPVIAAAAVALGVLELGVAWHAVTPAMVDPVLAAVIVAALLLRRRSAARPDADTSSWRASDDPRPVPPALARLPVVRLARYGGAAAVLVFAAVLPHLLSVDQSLRASALLIYAILGCSIVVLTGWAGLVSLGQVALFAFGAALGAAATSQWGLDLLAAMALCAAAGAVAAAAVGFPAMRLRGLELGVVTLAGALAATSWLLNPRFFDWVPTGRIERPALLGRIDIDSPTRVYMLVLVVLVLVVVGMAGIRRSRTGRALLALRDNERAAQAYGLSPLRLRLGAFALSGGIAGLAGCLFAHHQQAFGTQPFLPEQNLAVFTMVVLGGVGSALGAVLGALWLQGTRWFLPADWQLLASGAGVLLVLLILPGGLGGLAVRLRDRWLGKVARDRGLEVPGFTPDAPEGTPGDRDGTPGEQLAFPGSTGSTGSTGSADDRVGASSLGVSR